MVECGAYGVNVGKYFGVPYPPSLVMKTTGGASLAVTRLRSDGLGHEELTASIPRERAFIVTAQLQEMPSHELQLNGRRLPVRTQPVDAITAVDLELRPEWQLRGQFDFLHFYLSRAALDEIADGNRAGRIGSLSISANEAVFDPVITRLGTCLIPILEQPQKASRSFLENVLLALSTHVAHRYGGMVVVQSVARGGLAPWQERRAKECMTADLQSDLPLASLAAECSLSPRHFSRAFRQSTGHTPHRWRLERRVDLAKKMLLDAGRSITEIALDCGFADQSHFTRMFSQLNGVGPAGWRRAHRAGPCHPQLSFAHLLATRQADLRPDRMYSHTLAATSAG
jgi:AraC-like DNA-binding protein